MGNLKFELLQSQLETQEHSFNNISRELHDNIGQLLSSTKFLLNIAAMELQNIPDTFKTAEHTIGKAIKDLRLISGSISNEWLHNFNLIESINAEKERINTAKKVEVEFTSDYEQLPIEPENQVMLFRIIHEAIHNSLKHAAPKNIVIQLKKSTQNIVIIIEDNGRIIDFHSKKETYEFHKMKHRTELLGGNIEWKSDIEKGTTIIINIPIKKEEIFYDDVPLTSKL